MLDWIKFVFENPASLPFVILLGAGWICWVYGRFLWNKGERGFRKLTLPLLIAASILLFTAGPVAGYVYLYRGLPSGFNDSEIGILVAKVPGDKESEWQSKYARAILEQVNNNPQLHGVIKVRLLERPLP